jgi:hypothetical protein
MMEISREELLMKLGAARDQSCSAWRLVVIKVAADSASFSYRLDRNKLRQARSREGRYLLRTNLIEEDPAKLWSHYLLLVCGRGGVQEPQKPAPAEAGGDLAIRPIFHQLEARIEVHVFIAFLAYCLHVTLARRLHVLAPGLHPVLAPAPYSDIPPARFIAQQFSSSQSAVAPGRRSSRLP